MAGIVAAETDNGSGIAGTAYAGVSVLPVTVLGADGTGQDSDIIAGVVYAADAGADVILMSFSNPGFSPALQAAIDYAWTSGAVLVAATGNDGSSTATFPAGDRGVIGVASTDAFDALAASSNYGSSVFLAAPGVDIATTSAGGSVATISGTSAAAAEVAGAAALLLANEPALSNGVIVVAPRAHRRSGRRPGRDRQRPPQPRPRHGRRLDRRDPARWRCAGRRRWPARWPVRGRRPAKNMDTFADLRDSRTRPRVSSSCGDTTYGGNGRLNLHDFQHICLGGNSGHGDAVSDGRRGRRRR